MNSLVRSQGWPLAPGTQDGNWIWDGSNWVCDPDCGNGGSQPCPPFGPPVFSGPTQQPPWYPGANGGVSFGASAPANPVRGHMWWDGKTFWLFDGAAWVAVGGTNTPLLGVTDGSNALPGYVGEFLSWSATLNFQATTVSQNVPIGILPPGDWDLGGFAGGWSVPVQASEISLNPQPPGFSSSMVSFMLGEYMPMTAARASISVATTLLFVSNVTGVSAAGNGQLNITARRRR
jgi:hypothetical protein